MLLINVGADLGNTYVMVQDDLAYTASGQLGREVASSR